MAWNPCDQNGPQVGPTSPSSIQVLELSCPKSGAHQKYEVSGAAVNGRGCGHHCLIARVPTTHGIWTARKVRMRGIRPCLFWVVRPPLGELEKARFIVALLLVQNVISTTCGQGAVHTAVR
eukprot:4370639-Pyramimonas_sp.AAC.1